MTKTDHNAPGALPTVGKLLQFFVYAPLGASVKLIEDGPAVIGKARQELSNARFIGKLVVSQGEAKLRERLSDSDRPAADIEPEPQTVAAAEVVSVVEAIVEPEVEFEGDEDRESEIEPGELALPDYDHLPAIDIVGQLDSLSADELDEIETYERANRRRRTVLGKIAQLRAGS